MPLPILEEEERKRKLREQALQGNAVFPLTGQDQQGGLQAEGPGSAATAINEQLLAEASARSGGNDAAVRRAVEEASPEALAGNPTTTPEIDGAVEDNPSPKRFKEMTRGEKFSAILKVLGQAAAVYGSNDPGAAVQAQINALAQEREFLNARRARARERREDRQFSREQFANERTAQEERERRLQTARDREAREARQFDLQRDLERFTRESGFQREERENREAFQREERQSLRAEDRAERRQGKITELTVQLGANLASLGENDEGQRDPLSRARRVATAIVDGTVDDLGDGDKAQLEFMLRKREATSPAEERMALIDAASRLVGKPQPVPQTEQVFLPNGSPALDENGERVFQTKVDPATGRVLPKLDALGNVVKVPMSKEEALAFVTFGMEDRDFFNNRVVDPEEVAINEQMDEVDPGEIEPRHLLDAENRKGLISVVVGDAETAEEQRERMELFEEDMISRGYRPFTKEVRKVLDAYFARKDRDDKLVDKLAPLVNRDSPAVRALRQTGFSTQADNASKVEEQRRRRQRRD